MAHYALCHYCKRYVNVTKPIFGSLHFCLTDEEKELVRQMDRQKKASGLK